jgi:hypothetical protein
MQECLDKHTECKALLEHHLANPDGTILQQQLIASLRAMIRLYEKLITAEDLI